MKKAILCFIFSAHLSLSVCHSVSLFLCAFNKFFRRGQIFLILDIFGFLKSV